MHRQRFRASVRSYDSSFFSQREEPEQEVKLLSNLFLRRFCFVCRATTTFKLMKNEV